MNYFKKIIAIILTIDLVFVSNAFTSFAEINDESETVVTTVTTNNDESETTTIVSNSETGEENASIVKGENSMTSDEEEGSSESSNDDEPENDTDTSRSIGDDDTDSSTTISEVFVDSSSSADKNEENYLYEDQSASESEITCEEVSAVSTNSFILKDENIFGIDELEWTFSTFGTGVNTTNNGHNGEYADGTVEVFSTNKKGKLVPASTDGLAFYYTKINPATKNFKLSADADVISWNLSNGQDGFGLMACDRVGVNGDSTTFWNNSYMASVTKVEYFWDGQAVSTSGDKISMKLGVGSQEKKGVTLDNIKPDYTLDDMSLFSSTMTTLDTTCASSGAGTYNLVGNYTNNPAPIGTIANPRTTFHLSIEKNNTGYFVSYTNPDGDVTTKKYYDPNVLNYLDPDFVYLGFFAARNADVNFTNISFTTSDPSTDPAPEDPDLTYVDPNYQVISASVANSSDYKLMFLANADGTLSVNNNGRDIFSGAVTANEALSIMTEIVKGDNEFALVMTPDPNYRPSEHEMLSSYDPATIIHRVHFSDSDKEVVFVSPNGLPQNDGSRNKPIIITEAVKKAIPGQTIYLMEGVYKLSETLVIERGMNGTKSKSINLYVDPIAKSRPILDFQKVGGGVTLAGDYWHLKGFDITKTADMQKGLLIAGNYNTIELVNTYRNGNTGIQLSRYKGSDTRSLWPVHNLVLNCTSYSNADQGYEDADGFAAKITCGEGNVFDGCISAYNADDGWDLFAKLETGSIGQVVIKNSIAYKSGYILDEDGKERLAGNGNGFKLGGESITGHHKLINSIAFANSEKGIDSNSCPDIIVERCTSFNNGSHNVALYTNTASNTDFDMTGVLSYKNNNLVEEKISPVGTQDTKKIYKEANYYYKDGKFANSVGKEVDESWFVSLDIESALNGGITRNEDGSINMNGFLELTGNVPNGVGAVFNKPSPAPTPSGGGTGDGGDSSGPTRGPMGDLTKNPAYANLLNNNILNTTNNIPKSNLVNDVALISLLKSLPENVQSNYVNVKDDKGNTGFGQWLRVPNTTTWYFLSGNANDALNPNSNYGFVSSGWYNLSWSGEDKWYHFDKNGVMQLGWYQENGKMYYLQDNISDKWYGQLLTGSQIINGNIYNFDETGALIQ